MIKNNVDHLLDVLISSFSEVLVLLVRLALSGPYEQGAKDLLNMVADLNLSSIPNELGWGTMLVSDVIH